MKVDFLVEKYLNEASGPSFEILDELDINNVYQEKIVEEWMNELKNKKEYLLSKNESNLSATQMKKVSQILKKEEINFEIKDKGIIFRLTNDLKKYIRCIFSVVIYKTALEISKETKGREELIAEYDYFERNCYYQFYY